MRTLTVKKEMLYFQPQIGRGPNDTKKPRHPGCTTARYHRQFVFIEMAGVTIKKVSVLNNPAPFTEPFQFEITYEAVQDLDDGTLSIRLFLNILWTDLEWKVSYLSSPSDASFDQELENVLVGPIASGVYKFILEVFNPPFKDLSDNAVLGRCTGWNKGAFG